MYAVIVAWINVDPRISTASDAKAMTDNCKLKSHCFASHESRD